MPEYDASNSDAQGFNWRQGQQTADAPGAPQVTMNVDDFEIPDVSLDVDAERIEHDQRERDFFACPVGPQHLEVVGFIGPFTQEQKRVYLYGEERTLTAFQAKVKLGMVSDHRFQVVDTFLMPPDPVADPDMFRLYMEGSTKKDGSTAGFHAQKFGFFINRIFPGQFSAGQSLPPVARRPAAWVKQKVYAVVEEQKGGEVRIDPRTDRPYPPRIQVKLYSYSDRPISTAQPPRPPGAAQPRPGQPLPGQRSFLPPAPQPQPGAYGQPKPAAPSPAEQLQRTNLGGL